MLQKTGHVRRSSPCSRHRAQIQKVRSKSTMFHYFFAPMNVARMWFKWFLDHVQVIDLNKYWYHTLAAFTCLGILYIIFMYTWLICPCQIYSRDRKVNCHHQTTADSSQNRYKGISVVCVANMNNLCVCVRMCAYALLMCASVCLLLCEGLGSNRVFEREIEMERALEREREREI